MKELSRITGKIRAIWKRLADRQYREAYLAGKVANEIAFQVYFLREHRGWTQGDLATRAQTQQPAISRVERSVGSVNLGTLLKIASALGVGLSVRFVPFSKLVAQAIGDELSDRVQAFEDDFPPMPMERTHLAFTSTVQPIRITQALTPKLPRGISYEPEVEQLMILKEGSAAVGENRYVQ